MLGKETQFWLSLRKTDEKFKAYKTEQSGNMGLFTIRKISYS
jgi:hypothetical protein